MGQLDGMSALIVGASSPKGLGEAVARLYAEQGAKVGLTGRKKESCDALAQELGGISIGCDITSEDSIKAAIKAMTDAYGKLDIAVNSAGIYAPMDVTEMTWDNLQMYADAHFIGPSMFIKHCADTMAQSGGGSIMTMSSLTVELTSTGTAGYAAAKAATDKMVTLAAHAYGPKGVRVNSVSPGLTPTPMTNDLFAIPTVTPAFLKETPLRKMPTIEDVAFTCLYLADPRCIATGDFLRVSGGGHLGRLPTMEEMMGG